MSLAALLKFQFTPLREGRPTTRFQMSQSGIFQFTPLREGRHMMRSTDGYDREFQFTPLREGRPTVVYQ